ncbi:hypothetical protein GOP47_0009519 [Adiantum capillus-veneris]|uniref:Uncharacterized protein n=1 Tax=Adiantum capillus-veneris TaxID=13818 RepID=A0A9D4ZH89_ADICA|nr:hypothetical protein GOP47_0009519 [Adiantum capillus-veneris]
MRSWERHFEVNEEKLGMVMVQNPDGTWPTPAAEVQLDASMVLLRASVDIVTPDVQHLKHWPLVEDDHRQQQLRHEQALIMPAHLFRNIHSTPHLPPKAMLRCLSTLGLVNLTAAASHRIPFLAADIAAAARHLQLLIYKDTQAMCTDFLAHSLEGFPDSVLTHLSLLGNNQFGEILRVSLVFRHLSLDGRGLVENHVI